MLGSRVELFRGTRIYPEAGDENSNGRCLRCIQHSKNCIEIFSLILIPSMCAAATYAGTACAFDVCRISPDNYLGIGACSVLAAAGAGGFLYSAVKGVKFICAQRKQKIDHQNLMEGVQGKI